MDGSKTSNGISRPSPEDLIIAQLEKSLLMMEADYAATIAAGTRQAPTAAAASVVPNVEGLNGHHAGIQDDDDWGSDGDEECGLPEGYQPLGMGGFGSDSDGEEADKEEDGDEEHGGDDDDADKSREDIKDRDGTTLPPHVEQTAGAAGLIAPPPLTDEDAAAIMAGMSGLKLEEPEWAKGLDQATFNAQVNKLLLDAGLDFSK